MKTHSLIKLRWPVILLVFLIICSGCARRAQKPETTPTESREPASTSPPAAPKESGPPSREPPRPPTPAPSTGSVPPQKESYYSHTVKWSGETLSIIAAWYTGDLENYKALADVMTQNNPNFNINRIYVGNKILIPESLLKTRSPMTKEFVDAYYPKPKTEKASPKRPQTDEEEPKLFGPKELPKQ